MPNTAPTCPVDATLRLIGGKYKALILWHLNDCPLRHGALQRLVPAASPKMLTQQLRELEADQLVARKVYPVVPPKVEYSLTDLGRSLRAILEALYVWGEDYMSSKDLEVCCTMTPPAPTRTTA